MKNGCDYEMEKNPRKKLRLESKVRCENCYVEV